MTRYCTYCSHSGLMSNKYLEAKTRFSDSDFLTTPMASAFEGFGFLATSGCKSGCVVQPFFPMMQPCSKTFQLCLVAYMALALMQGLFPWSFTVGSSQLASHCAQLPSGRLSPFTGRWKCQLRSALRAGKAFLKHVAFGVNSTQYYVESEWGRHWLVREWNGNDVLSDRKAAGNSTRAECASFGPNYQLYLEFDDWKYWKIDDPEIKKLVKENPVKFVSFGPNGAIVLVWKSGAYYFRGLASTLLDFEGAGFSSGSIFT